MDLLRKKYKPINEIQITRSGSGKKRTAAGTADNAAANTNGSADCQDDGLVESSGFRRAAHSLFPAERLADGWRTVRPIGPGLNNLGNTCFLNSVLQCLTYTPPLAEYLLTREHSSSCRAGDNCILCKFEAHVVRALSKRESSSISPKPVVGRLKLIAKHMRVGRQEDAHEFLRLLIESFQRSLMHGIDSKIDRRIQETTLTHQIFGGYLQSQVHCSRCGHDSNTFEPLLELNLDIQSGSTIAKALRSFVRPDSLSKDNRYKCEKCCKLVDATKQMTVYHLPRILTLQLKRFSVFGGGKINRFVEFPLSLDMCSYVSKTSKENGSFIYNLYAVLVHSGGTARSGHYYCFVKSPAGVWYELDDSTVHQVSERTVLKQTAYLLFYERTTAKSGPKYFGKKQEAEYPSTSKDVPTQAGSVCKPKHTSNGKHIPTASDDMEDLLQSNGTPLLRKESKKEKRKNKKKDNQENGHFSENLPLITQDTSLSETDIPKKPTSIITAAAINGKRYTNGTVVGLGDVENELSKLMWQAPSRPKEEKESSGGLQEGSSPSSSAWIVRSKSSKVQVVGWNEDAASKRSKLAAVTDSVVHNGENGWDVAEVRGNRTSQYGANVESWAGNSSAADNVSGAGKPKKKRQRRPDSYDTEYDRGRVKKVKKNKVNKFASTINPFQMLSEHTSKKNKSKH
ncbi:hypothetical protein EDC05_003539 [Coemansia umbellata]|nr:hypothetical protein EDC05_003539 [Coemansia umbellata]